MKRTDDGKTDLASQTGGRGDPRQEPRDERLKAALRANLHRRKLQARARAAGEMSQGNGQDKG